MVLSHLDNDGKARMSDVSGKAETFRQARAYAKITVGEEIFNLIRDNKLKKGDVLAVAKIAGIQAAKRTAELIPLCHNIFISDISLEFKLIEADFSIEITSTAKTNAPTGIEMEALTAVSVAALTIYDMCKGIDKSMEINSIYLISKSGGKSGDYLRETK
jgi:molybdenum cofactor biosynthesis protein MoaC